jgi:hypothetical protein
MGSETLQTCHRFALVIAWLFAAGIALTHEGTPDPHHIVDAYNRRPVGALGWQRVSMRLSSNGKLSRTFTVVNVWDRTATATRVLYFLEGPDGLKGSRYLQIESETGQLEVYLFLPTSRRVLQIAPEEFSEGLLGSDFSYDDMRFRLPAQVASTSVAGRTSLDGREVYSLRHEACGTDSQTWRTLIEYISIDNPFLVGRDYFTEADLKAGRPGKWMRVKQFRDIGRVRIAESMIMQVRGGNSTTIDLKDLRIGLPSRVDTEFTPAQLPLLDVTLRRGWPIR